MPFDIDVFVSYAGDDNVSPPAEDKGWVANFVKVLELLLSQRAGRRAAVHYATSGPADGGVLAEDVTDRIRRSAAFISIVSPRSVASTRARLELDAFVQAAKEHSGSATGRLFKVLTHPVPLEQHAAELQTFIGYEFFSTDPETGTVRTVDMTSGPETERRFFLKMTELAFDLASGLQMIAAAAESSTAPPAPPASVPSASVARRARAPRPAADDAPGGALERVLLGVSAPVTSRPGGSFVARFVAYVDALSDVVAQQLRGLDVHGDSRTVLGLAPERASRWRIGTPVTVRVGGSHLQVKPSERVFEWSGGQNLLGFIVEVNAAAPAGQAVLCFEAFIEGVSVAFIPMTLTIGEDGRSSERSGDED